jgi:uncharacterized membrane protein YfcA
MWTALFSVLAGISSGLFGVGGGIVLVPVFHYLLKMNMHQAIGTSLVIIVPTALTAALRHAGKDYVDWRVAVFSAILAILGSFIGAGVSMNLDVTVLRRLFAVFLLVVAVKMFFK